MNILAGHARTATRPVVVSLTIAALLGTAHGLFSLYWAVGGTWLLATIGHQLVAAFAEARWLLIPVGLVKVGFGLLPSALAALRWPRPRLWRPVCWLGAVVLIGWGGANTVTGNLVLGGLIHPTGGYDRQAMMGHAWLWDPLFLLWGLALATGLAATTRRRQ